MIKRQLLSFLLRIIISSFGMYLCITWFATTTTPLSTGLFVLAGAIFSLINSTLKPLAKLMALPLAIITTGISTLLINLGMIALTIYFLPGVTMGFWGILASSLILSLINSLVNLLIPAYNKQ